jgi:hypothetical protein
MLFVRAMSGSGFGSGSGSSFFTACLTDLYLEYLGCGDVVADEADSFSSDIFFFFFFFGSRVIINIALQFGGSFVAMRLRMGGSW